MTRSTACGFEWLDCNDAGNPALCYLRRDDDDAVIVVLNFTPVPRHGYRVGVPVSGHHRELLNTDAAGYGGSNLGNLGGVDSEARPWMGRPHSLLPPLPPLAAPVLSR